MNKLQGIVLILAIMVAIVGVLVLHSDKAKASPNYCTNYTCPGNIAGCFALYDCSTTCTDPTTGLLVFVLPGDSISHHSCCGPDHFKKSWCTF